MIKIQQEFCRLLLAKKIELKESKAMVNEVSITSIGRWQAEKSSPSLKDVEHILIANNMPTPFFYDGTIDSLMAFNKKEASKLGMGVEFIFKEK